MKSSANKKARSVNRTTETKKLLLYSINWIIINNNPNKIVKKRCEEEKKNFF